MYLIVSSCYNSCSSSCCSNRSIYNNIEENNINANSYKLCILY